MSSDFECLDLGVDFSKVKNIVLLNKPEDLRKGIDGYASVIQRIHHLDPTDVNANVKCTNYCRLKFANINASLDLMR